MKTLSLWVAKSIAILTITIYGISLFDFETFFITIESLNLNFLFLFLLVSFLHRIICAWRLCYISPLFSATQKLSLFYSFRIFIFAELVSVILPSSYSGEVARILKLRKLDITIKQASFIVLFDHLTGLLFLTLISIATLIFVDSNVLDIVNFNHEKYVFLLLFICACFAYFFRKKLLTLFYFFNLKTNSLTIVKIIALSITLTGAAIAIFLCAFESVNIKLDLSTVIAILFLSYLSKTIPLSIAGVGASEMTFVALCIFFGVSQESALVVVLLLLSARYLFSFLSAVIEVSCDGIEVVKRTLQHSMDKI